MRKVSVVHCADIHYDSEIKFLGTKERKRCEERRASFEGILKMCRTEGIDFLLIAGDLFDSPEPEEKYVKRLRDEFGKCCNTYIFISPGNHDYVSASSPYSREGFWPENVYIFRGEWEGVDIEDEEVSVYGAGFTKMHQRESMLKSCGNDGFIHLGVMHGDIGGKSLYNPVDASGIAGSGLDYLALGHIHKRTKILKEGDTFYAYSGCHDARGFDEPGIQGIYKGYVWKGGCMMEFVPVSTRCFYKMRVDISDMQDDDIIQYIEDNLPGTYEDIYEIVLVGNVSSEYGPDTDMICERAGLFYVKILQDYSHYYDYGALMGENSVRGEFVRRMMSLSGQGEDSVMSKALELGTAAFSKEVNYHED